MRDNIDADLDILRALAYTLDHLPFSFSKTLKWLNLGGMAEEFASMLKIQLDLRTEAMHLNKFNKNFAKDPHVIFPKVLKKTFHVFHYSLFACFIHLIKRLFVNVFHTLLGGERIQSS